MPDLRQFATPVRILRAVLGLIALLWVIYLCRTGWTREVGLTDIPEHSQGWPKTGYFLHNGWYYAALGSLPLCLAGIVLAPWLTRPPRPEDHSATPGLEGHFRRTFPLAAIASVLLSIWIGLPRLNHSLWGDENENFRQYAVGYFSRSSRDGELRFRERTLTDAAFRYVDTNNHQLYAVLGRLSHEVLGGLNKTDPTRPYMTEWKYRLPAMLGSLAGVVLVGWLFVRLGLPWAGVLTMPILALHPWFVRYATEARGYSLLFALGSAGMLCLLSALRRGRRRDWILFGLLLSLESLAFMGYAFGYAMAGGTAVLAILTGPAKARLPQLGGLALGAIASLLLWMPAYFPCLPGLRDYLETGDHHHKREMTVEWYENELTLFAVGTSWNEWDHANPNSVTVEDHPWPVWPKLILFAALVIVGSVRLALVPRARWFLLPLLLAAPITVAVFVSRQTYLYPWYLVTALPDYLGLAAAGVTWPMAAFKRLPRPALLQPLATGLAVAAVIGLFSWETQLQRSILRLHSLEPIRESVEFTRRRINPFLAPDPNVVTVGIYGENKGYDDHRIDVKEVGQFRELIERARRGNQRLFVDLGHYQYAHEQRPELMRMVDDPTLFEEVAVFWSGQEVQNTRRVFQLRPLPPPGAAPGS